MRQWEKHQSELATHDVFVGFEIIRPGRSVGILGEYMDTETCVIKLGTCEIDKK
jgi:hypothetical protein